MHVLTNINIGACLPRNITETYQYKIITPSFAAHEANTEVEPFIFPQIPLAVFKTEGSQVGRSGPSPVLHLNNQKVLNIMINYIIYLSIHMLWLKQLLFKTKGEFSFWVYLLSFGFIMISLLLLHSFISCGLAQDIK